MSINLEALVEDVQREHAQNHSVSRGAITPRQTEILRMLCDGKSPKQIARELGISHRTVENHRWRIHQKTGCGGVKLGVWAAKNGVV
jgi:DNA-binding CsgD family transcriptional regulator